MAMDTSTQVPSASLKLTHSAAEGTLLRDTTRGDASRDVLRGMYEGWDWGRSIGCWYIRHSRDREPNQRVIDLTAERLRAAGFEVEVEVDATLRPTAEVEADRAARMEARADRLDERAQRLQGQSAARRASADAVFDAIPFGQPLQHPSHHSYKADRNRRERARDNLGKSFELAGQASEVARRADAAADHMERRENPVTVANRIQKLEAEIRDLERRQAGRLTWQQEQDAIATGDRLVLVPPDGAYKTQLEARLVHVNEQLSYWREIRAQQIAEGAATNYGPETVKRGDFVLFLGDWFVVVRANAKTATIPSMVGGGWTDTVPWQKIKDHILLADLEAAVEAPVHAASAEAS